MLESLIDMIQVKQKFLKEIQEKIQSITSVIVQGNLDPVAYAKSCTELTTLRETQELFLEIWNKYMKENDDSNENF